MDIRTLAVVTCVCAATMAVTLGLMSRLSASDRCLKEWALAGLLFFGNSLVGVFGLTHTPHVSPVLVALANASVVTAYWLMASGLRAYLGRRSFWQGAFLLGGVTLVVNLLPAFARLELRLLFGWPLIVAAQALVAADIWRERGRRTRPAMRLLLVLTLFFATQQLIRWLVLAQAMAVGGGIDLTHPILTIGRLLMFAYLLFSTVLCALLVLQDKADELRRQADVDPMTGWHNRRTWDAAMEAEFQRSRRTGAGFHVVMFDIDHFKTVNDRYGHDIGDQAIRHVSAVVAQELRAYDRRFRIGGEEFAVCAPGLQAGALAERLRARVAAQPLPTAAGDIALTISVGYSEVDAGDTGWRAVAQRADQALYEAKRLGRNRAEGPPPAPMSDLALA